jgi:uncharacterized membrane protein YqiK
MFVYRKVDQGRALIVTRPGKVSVSFTGMFVVPIINRVEIMDISLNTIEIDRRGAEGLICRDNIRADIKVAFFVRVNKTVEDVIKVAQAIGCKRASDHKTLEELFSAKFSEALKTVGKQLDFIDLYTKREDFRDRIIEVIGRDLNGYVLEDAAIDYLEQTPMSSLDEHNILDAQGIRKITELTTREHIATNDFERNEEKQIKKQDVEARETILELERQQADAESKQEREIQVVRAREQAETLKIQAEERLRAETARIKTDQDLAIQEENKQREVDVAGKNRERVVAVEIERVEKDRALEAIARERETELQRIAKEKEVEVEKKEIADVIRERLAVERTQAEEEERIKELRVVEEARRTKEAVIIAAEAEAQERLVKEIKAAEAAEEVATHKAKERLTLADANLEASDRDARAKIRLAEGVQAEVAATGLAEVKVKEADAAAIEKVGGAEARVTLEKMQAEAEGTKIRGQADAHVKEIDADATEKHGKAEAIVLKEKGLAEAVAIKERLAAEADGLREKAAAMHELDEAGRGHEEFRIELETRKAIAMEAIEAQRMVAEAQARILADALKAAKIDIVGGESIFLDRLVNAISMGKSVDGFFDRSESASTVLGDYLSGDANLPKDLKEVLTNSKLSPQDVQSLSLSAVLAGLMTRSDSAGRAKLQALADKAQELGIDDIDVK